jgi:hypothetical protein
MDSALLSTIIKIIAYIAPVIAIYLLVIILKNRKKVEEFLEKEYSVLSILVPKNNEKTPLAAEQLFASLHGIFRPGEGQQDHLSLEIASEDKFTQFYVTVPSYLKRYVEGQIYAQYPTVEIKEVPDYTNIDTSGMALAGTELVLSKEDVYPIKTFQSFEVDPLAGITGALSRVEGSERVWIQIFTRQVDDS